LPVNGKGLMMQRLDRMVGFDDETGILDAEAGVELGDILAVFGPRGWMPAVLPGTGKTTLGGAICNDVHGKNHHVEGSFGQHVESFDLITAEGDTRRVSEATEPELFRATIGGVGQTGLVASARIRLARCPSMAMSVREERMPDLDAFMDAFENAAERFQVGWIDALQTGASLGRGVFEAGEFAPAWTSVKSKPGGKSLPVTPPGLCLAAPFVRLFNAGYFKRIPAAGRTRMRPLNDFFFPLDRISNWNKVYGKRGFQQFQCVIPDEHARRGLRAILEAIADAGIASPLAVIKRMGPGRAGYLSFPMEGYSLAVDLPNRSGTGDLAEALIRLALDHGGRIYLAKDSAASRAAFAAMYPEVSDFRAVVARMDPGGKFTSAMAQRLELRGA